MFKIQLEIDVDVSNYEEIVKKQKGEIASFFINILASRERIGREVDAEIAKRLVSELPDNLSQEIAKSLAQNGVKASVRASARQVPSPRNPPASKAPSAPRPQKATES